jgi:hypothetical protein
MDIVPSLKYNYEKHEDGLKGAMHLHGNGTISHLSIPVGLVIVRENHSTIPHYAEQENYETVNDELFDKLLEKCSKPIAKENTRKNREIYSKTKKNKKSE